MLNRIGEFVQNFFAQLLKVLQWLLDGLIYIVSEVFYFIFDGLLIVVETVITGIDLAQYSMFQAFQDWGLLPDQVLYVLNRLNFAQCLTFLATAYGIRLLINIVPAAFTRV